MREYLTDRFGAAGSSATPGDARRILTEGGVEPALVDDFVEVLQRCFEAGYAGSTAARHPETVRDCARACETIRRIERRSPAPSNVRRAWMLLLGLGIPLVAGWTHVDRSPEENGRFLWDQASARMAAARTPEDFLLAANTYRGLVGKGVRNGHLFYNLGTALMLAGQYEQAAASLLRAERYLGTTPDIERNLVISMARKSGGADGMPWHRIPFFWHYRLATSTRLTIAVWASAGCWLALILRLLDRRGAAERLFLVAVVALVLFSSSAATSVLQERSDQQTRSLSGR
jgi:hypothetical protein